MQQQAILNSTQEARIAMAVLVGCPLPAQHSGDAYQALMLGAPSTS
jgi:hypothetical protein